MYSKLNPSNAFRLCGGPILCVLVLIAAGCGDVDEIRRYQVPKMKTAEAKEPAPKESDDTAFRFETPEGWKPGELVILRGGISIRHQAAFEVTDGQQRVKVTADRMPAMGSFIMNVNRWRRQIGLEPVESDELDAMVESIKIDGASADYVKLVGQSETVLGIVAVRGREAWYLKLKGDSELAEREKDNFETFVKSIKFK